MSTLDMGILNIASSTPVNFSNEYLVKRLAIDENLMQHMFDLLFHYAPVASHQAADILRNKWDESIAKLDADTTL